MTEILPFFVFPDTLSNQIILRIWDNITSNKAADTVIYMYGMRSETLFIKFSFGTLLTKFSGVNTGDPVNRNALTDDCGSWILRFVSGRITEVKIDTTR